MRRVFCSFSESVWGPVPKQIENGRNTGQDFKLEETMSIKLKLVSALSSVAILASTAAVQADVLFWSTQAKPVEEAQAMREKVLAGAGDVDYQPNDGGPWLTRLQAELQAGSGSIGVLGAISLGVTV